MVAETPHTVVEGGMKISHAIDFQTTHRRRPVLTAALTSQELLY